MATSSAERRSGHARAVPLLVAVVVTVLFLPWWCGARAEVWQVAEGFVDAVRDGDCESAAKFSTINPTAADCSTQSYGLPEDLRGYSVSMNWLSSDRTAGSATAVSLKIPGYRDDYGLSLSRLGDRWVITDVIVLIEASR